VRCQYFRTIAGSPGGRLLRDNDSAEAQPERRAGEGYELFSQAHLEALVEIANCDSAFRAAGHETGLTTSLTLSLDEAGCAWTVKFADGEITGLEESDSGVFRIAAKAEWWKAVFANRIDPFLATQQKKLRLERGELAAMSRWYKPFQRAFALWQTIPVL
jgi:putative sterol carrier protein